jgi:flavodoxin
MKTLIAYYSKTGTTAKVAKDLASRIGADIEEIVDRKKRSGIWGWLSSGRDGMNKSLTEIEKMKNDPSEYDVVILGSPIWGWDMVPAIRTYISENKDSFKQVGLFTTSGGTDIEKITPSFEEALGKKLKASVGFVPVEIKNMKTYQDKIGKFIEKIK